MAYQVFGKGARDILFVTHWGTNVDAMWDEPAVAHFFQRLSRNGRVICYDKRGTGVSDPVPLASLPTLESWMDDARLALDAAGSGQACVIGDTEGGPMAMLLAATHPERVERLVLLNTFARWRRDEDYPIGMPEPTVEKLVSRYEQHWGQDPAMMHLTAPSLEGDARAEEWSMRYQRLSMPPGAATQMYRWVTQIDVRSVLPTISMPTLVLHRRRTGTTGCRSGSTSPSTSPARGWSSCPGRTAIRFPHRRPTTCWRRSPRSCRTPRWRYGRTRAVHGAVHGHRRLDRSGCPARRLAVARPARGS